MTETCCWEQGAESTGLLVPVLAQGLGEAASLGAEAGFALAPGPVWLGTQSSLALAMTVVRGGASAPCSPVYVDSYRD